MKKYVYFWLLAILLLAITIRLLPLFNYSIWGSDTGEYYVLTKRLVERGCLSFDYEGWGFGYPYFPGLFIITGGTTLLLSSNLITTLLILTPVISALSAILIFLITKEIFQNINAALLASLLSSVAIPHVFTTSHSMPGSIGDLLLIFCILLFLKSYKSKKFVPLLFCSSLALVVTHHLSAFFLFLTIIIFVFVRELLQSKSDSKTLRFELSYLAYLFIAVITQWFFVAVPFKNVITDAFDIPAEIVLVLALLCFFLMFLIIKLRRKLSLREYLPKYPSYKRLLLTYGSALLVSFSVLFISVFVKVPGTTISIDKTAILLFSPSIIVFCLAIFGTGFSSYYKNGLFLFCWLLAIACTMVLGVATSNTVLIPYRHLQYIIVPAAIFAGFGSLKLIELAKRKKLIKTLVACSFVILLLIAPYSCYPPKSVLGGFEEGTPTQNINLLVWAREYLASETVASDHRISSLLFGFANCKPSWEFTSKVFHSSNFSDCKEELRKAGIPAGKMRINYVVIDNIIKQGVCLKQWEPALQMSKESLAKFEKEPFIKIYDDGFAQVYTISWERIRW